MRLPYLNTRAATRLLSHCPRLTWRRCWCLWEILQTVLCGATLTVLLPPSEGVLFERALVEDFDSIATSLAKVDVRRSEAFKVEDQRMILGAVEQGVGFTKLNQVVGGQLREWLTAQAQAALARLPAEERGTSVLINQLGMQQKERATTTVAVLGP